MADPQRSCVYAIDRVNSNILFIDPVTRAVAKTIYVGKDPTGLDIDATGKRLFVANKGPGTGVPGSYRIAVVDLDTRTEVSSFVLVQRAVNVTAGAAGRLYYNAGYDLWNGGDGRVLNTVTGTDQGSFAGVKSRMVISSDKGRLYGQYAYYANLGQMGVWNVSSGHNVLVDTLAYSPYPYGWDYDNYCLSGNDRCLAYGRIFFNATNLLDQAGVFPEQVYELNHDGSVAFGSSAIWDSTTFKIHGDATKISNLPFASTIMDFDDPTGTLYVFNSADNCLSAIVFEPAVTVVTFAVGAGTVNPASKTVTFGEPYGALPTPALAGHIFMGWLATTNGFTFNVTSNTVVPVSENHTLAAGWTASTYTVAFNANGGTVSPADKVVTFGSPYGNLPEPARTGYTFTGWTTFNKGWFHGVTSNSVVSIPSDHTLFATWTAKTCTLTFDAQGGLVNPASMTVTFDSAYGTLPVPAMPAPFRADYLFGGWFTGKSGTGTMIMEETVVTDTADHTLYAKWTAEPYVCDPAGDAPLTASGQYAGYFYSWLPFAETNVPSIRGTFALVLSRTNGAFTAKAHLQQGQVSFGAGAWSSQDADGTRRITQTARSGETLALAVRQNRIWGTLSGGSLDGETLMIDGARNRFISRPDTAAKAILETYKGYYTVSLPPNAVDLCGSAQRSPEGSGYLTLTVGSGGTVMIAGRLADGTPFSQSSALILFDGCGPQACVPLFLPLYMRQGWLGGLLWFTPSGKGPVTTDRDLGWFARWEIPSFRPDGASVLLDAVGGYFSTVHALAAHYGLTAESNAVPYAYSGGAADLQTAALPDGIGVTVKGARLITARGTRPALVSGAYDYSAENSAMATLDYAPATGLFKGQFNLYYDYTLGGRPRHTAVRVSYAGVLTPTRAAVFADHPAGQGYYTLPDKTSFWSNSGPVWVANGLNRSYRITLDEAP